MLAELESHLRDDVQRQMRTGLGAQESFQAAVQRLGGPAELSGEFERARGTNEERERRWKLLWLAFAGLVVLAIEGIIMYVAMAILEQRMTGWAQRSGFAQN